MKKCDTSGFHREQRGKWVDVLCILLCLFGCAPVHQALVHLRWHFTCELSY